MKSYEMVILEIIRFERDNDVIVTSSKTTTPETDNSIGLDEEDE